jgi:hypothetical protein
LYFLYTVMLSIAFLIHHLIFVLESKLTPLYSFLPYE